MWSRAGRAEPGSHGRSGPFGLWAALCVGLGAVFWASAAKPLSDPDIWWHVRTGELILDQGVPRTEPWAFTALGNPWVPTAWLSDVVLATQHGAFGRTGVVGFKLVVAGALIVALGREIFRRAAGPTAAAVFVLSLITISPFLAERPQLVSLVLTVWLARQAMNSLEGAAVPLTALPIAYVWANLHGLWVLVPACMGVIAVGLLLERPPRWRARVTRASVVGLGAVALAALTPAGPRLAYWPLVVRDTAQDISEWQPTTLADRYGVVYLAVFLLWVAARTHGNHGSPAETTWMMSMFGLGLLAGRNVAPTVILMAPIAARALSEAYPHASGWLSRPRVPVLAIVAMLSGAATLAATVHVQRGALSDRLPHEIVAELDSRPGPVRVLNDYNIGGFLTGEGAPHISVAIDGRTDNYDAAFVDRYLGGVVQLIEWRDLVRDLDPDVAVLLAGSALDVELKEAGWSVVLRDGSYDLLEPPDAR
jgi:hypothetical protein